MLTLVGVTALAGAGYGYFASREDSAAQPRYQTETLHNGDLRVTVSATGQLAPVNEVEVGSELSGTVQEVFVDYNDPVEKGQLLARLDVAKLQDQIVKAKASLASAQAKVKQAEATVKESRANLKRLRQVSKLSGGKVPAPTELETAEATLERAVADKSSADAAVEEARATLRSNQTDLTKASILSPINGVVLERSIDPGQTVAASLEAPVLFNLAEDLTKMELQVDVDEADVGQVRDGQAATFTVDAFPERRYPAQISQVRFGAETVNNVVTYKTILKVANDDLSLRPGMTATAEIVTAESHDVLLVPNAALRFTPAKSTDESAGQSRSLLSSLLPRPPREPRKKQVQTTPRGDGDRTLWVLEDGQPVAVSVTAGETDGRLTEVSGSGVQAGMSVITGLASGKQ